MNISIKTLLAIIVAVLLTMSIAARFVPTTNSIEYCDDNYSNNVKIEPVHGSAIIKTFDLEDKYPSTPVGVSAIYIPYGVGRFPYIGTLYADDGK